MKRSVFLFGFIMILLSVVGLFQVNHRVQNLKKDLVEINRQLTANKEAIHVLNAEWAYLTEPSRIMRFSDRFLKINYAKYAQVKNSDEVGAVYAFYRREYQAPSVTPTLRPILSSMRSFR